ncbi:hypothetical protein OS493_027824 [Desmophyllum pertusum]|uniref:Uncharacterized protein n=1 Tax=Desmophyllum pertusum TaxID=174260 RepID=A0A9W9YXE9_9CNID|nr:hypothetical protein OS493_027824 [Desmophyllum pertusum]
MIIGKQEEVNKPTRKDTRNSGRFRGKPRLNQTRIHQLINQKTTGHRLAPASKPSGGGGGDWLGLGGWRGRRCGPGS